MLKPKARLPTLVGACVVAAVIAVVAVGSLTRARSTSSATIAPLVGHPAPRISLLDINGRQVSLAGYRGHPVLVNFFATWCIPCATEMPMIDRLYRLHRGQFNVLAVDKQEPRGDVSGYTRSRHLGFTPLLDSTGATASTYHVSVQPVSFWIGRDGVIESISYGEMTKQYAKSQLRRLGIG